VVPDPEELPDDLWGPSLRVRAVSKAIGLELQKTRHPIRYMRGQARSHGRLQRQLHFAGYIHNPMDLSDFPLDVDAVTFELYTESNWHSSSSAQVGQHARRLYALRPVGEEGGPVARNSLVSMWWDGMVAEWHFLGIGTAIEEIAAKDGDGGVERTNLRLHVHVARRSGFFFWKVLLPVFLLVFLSFSTFGFHTDDFAGRSSNVATYFLAMFAMLYVVSECLPKTDFLTKIDQTIVLGMFTLAFSGVVSQGVGWIHEQHNAGLALQWNSYATWGSACTYIAGVLIIFMPPLSRQRATRNLRAKSDVAGANCGSRSLGTSHAPLERSESATSPSVQLQPLYKAHTYTAAADLLLRTSGARERMPV
jgi:hypothetical protein